MFASSRPLCFLLMLALPACSDATPSAGDAGLTGDGAARQLDSVGPAFAGRIGGGSVVPRGTGGKGAFKRGVWHTLGRDSGGKSIPLLGSFDADGKLDVVLDVRVTAIYFFASKGGGAFAAPKKLKASILFAGGWGGDVGDVNGDGKLDVAFGDHVGGAVVFLGDGAGGFRESSPKEAGKPTYSGAGLADLDGDDSLDLLLGADQFAKGMNLYRGDGKGGWTLSKPPGLPALSKTGAGGLANTGTFAFDDFDLDGDLDIFAFGQSRAPGVTCEVYRNEGQGKRFTRVAQLLGESDLAGIGSPVQGSVGDVNGDRYPDVSSGGTIHLNDKSGAFGKPTKVDPARISHLADMNGDGKIDLVTHHSSQGLRLYLGDGTGKTWTADAKAALPDATVFPAGAAIKGKLSSAYGIDVGDVDGNGNLDVVRVFSASESTGFGSKGAVYLETWLR